jgi:hypothetical protein
MAGQVMRYADVQRLSWSVGRAQARSGIRPGDKVAVLSGNRLRAARREIALDLPELRPPGSARSSRPR